MHRCAVIPKVGRIATMPTDSTSTSPSGLIYHSVLGVRVVGCDSTVDVLPRG